MVAAFQTSYKLACQLAVRSQKPVHNYTTSVNREATTVMNIAPQIQPIVTETQARVEFFKLIPDTNIWLVHPFS